MPTERHARIRAWIGLRAAAVAAVLLAAAAATAHEPEPRIVRELVRLQGHVQTAPAGTKPTGEMALTVLGRRLPFAITGWRVFAFSEAAAVSGAPVQLTLQGDRSVLRLVTTARPEQRLTILGERRPGSGDLFVLEVDRCPAE